MTNTHSVLGQGSAGPNKDAPAGVAEPARAVVRAGAAAAALEAAGRRLSAGEREHLGRFLADLTPRERDVVAAVFEGGANEGIAERLGVRQTTLRTHITRINRKLGAGTKSDIVRVVAGALLEGYRTGRIVAGSDGESRRRV